MLVISSGRRLTQIRQYMVAMCQFHSTDCKKSQETGGRGSLRQILLTYFEMSHKEEWAAIGDTNFMIILNTVNFTAVNNSAKMNLLPYCVMHLSFTYTIFLVYLNWFQICMSHCLGQKAEAFHSMFHSIHSWRIGTDAHEV